jgi:hypothetical protein
MVNSEYAEPITLQIRSTFDVAIARNRLRHLGTAQNLPTLVQARASAAITTIAELVLYKTRQTNPLLTLTLRLVNQERRGLEFIFDAPFYREICPIFAIAEWQLQRACDEYRIDRFEMFDRIYLYLWCKRSPS